MKTKFPFITLSSFFILIGVCLTVTTILLNGGSRVEARTYLAPNLQQPPTPTPRPNCPVPPCPAAAYGRNPYPAEIAPYFNRVGLNQLTTDGPVLPTLTPNQSPYVPCVLLQAMAYQESRWRHFEADYNDYGYTKISPACAYGLTQVVSGMTGGGGFDQNRANQEVAYNLGVGALTLIKKWNALKLTSGGYPGGAYIVGEGNPQVAEDWYYAVWAYHGWG